MLIIGLVVAVSIALLPSGLALAQDIFPECKPGGAGVGTEFCKVVNNTEDPIEGDDSLVKNVVDVITLVSGMIAVIMVVIGGLRYVLSNGDPQGTQSAKNTILYAIVGVIIAIAARSIVLFVVDRV